MQGQDSDYSFRVTNPSVYSPSSRLAWVTSVVEAKGAIYFYLTLSQQESSSLRRFSVWWPVREKSETECSKGKEQTGRQKQRRENKGKKGFFFFKEKDTTEKYRRESKKRAIAEVSGLNSGAEWSPISSCEASL